MPLGASASSRVSPDTAAALRREDALHRLGAFSFLAVAIQAGVPLREVPAEYWERGEAPDGVDVAVVSCPCGNKPSPRLAEPPLSCECHRWFFYAGPEVWALGGEAPTA